MIKVTGCGCGCCDFSGSGMNLKGKRRRVLEDVPELMHHVQSRLSVEEAARTSVLSKSWLHAWCTIPNLRFHLPKEEEEEKIKERKHMTLLDVERTLKIYLDNNIPIESFELSISIENQESASLAEKLIRMVATKTTSVKELSLTIRPYGASLHLPYEILSGRNLTKIRVSVPIDGIHSVSMKTCHYHHPPKCVSLRELHLVGMHISEDVLHDILLSCSLLEKIKLLYCSKGLNSIKVKNLVCLEELQIVTMDTGSTGFEISHVPNLHVMGCNVHMNGMSRRFGPLMNEHSISLGSSITELSLGGGMIRDNASLDMIIKLGLPFLENLTLDMDCWMLGSFHFTCSDSIKRFSLLSCPCTLVDVVHVTAPKLLFFSFYGQTMPTLLFPDSTLEQIEFCLGLNVDRVDASFFLKMREALMLSRECSRLHIKTINHDLPLPLEIDIDDLRRRLPFPPATNLQKLSFKTTGDECLWECSPFFQAFFEICRPQQVTAWPDTMLKDKNHFCKLMLQVLMEKKNNSNTYWPRYLKDVQIERPDHNPKWETLSHSHTSFLQGPNPEHLPFKFILNWC